MRFKKHLNEGIFDKIFGKNKEEKSDLREDIIWDILDEKNIFPDSHMKFVKDPKPYTMKLPEGQTAIHEYLAKASFKKAVDDPGFEEFMEEILKNPNLLKALDRNNNTPLHIIALKIPLTSRVAYSVVYHQGATMLNNSGVSPLHILGLRGFKGILKRQESTTLKGYLGNTPAHYLAYYLSHVKYASKSEIEDFISRLHGQQPRNDDGHTPADVLKGNVYVGIPDFPSYIQLDEKEKLIY